MSRRAAVSDPQHRLQSQTCTLQNRENGQSAGSSESTVDRGVIGRGGRRDIPRHCETGRFLAAAPRVHLGDEQPCADGDAIVSVAGVGGGGGGGPGGARQRGVRVGV